MSTSLIVKRMQTNAVRTVAAVMFDVAALVAVLVGYFAALPSANAAQDSCPTVQVVFARGTNEAPGVGATGQALVDALNARLPGKTVDVYGVNYPASLDFGRAADGIVDASTKIASTVASCPTTKIVLGGYSQGAAVAGYTTTEAVPVGFALPAGITGPMSPAIAQHVAAVVLFGTPDSWFLNLVDHEAPPIAVGPLYAGKTLQLCAAGDPVCFPGGLDRGAHSSYKSNGMADQAADFAANRVGSPARAARVDQMAGQAPAPEPVPRLAN